MKNRVRDQSGAALLTILLFVVIMFILVTTMLAVAGNESVISGLHRDSVRAKEIAEGGLSEALRRIAQGHDHALTPAAECYDSNPNDAYFENSLMPGGSAQVRVCLQDVGTEGVVYEIQSNATVGLARRQLSLIAVQKVLRMLPNIVYGHNCSGNGDVEFLSGDIYCQTFVYHKTPESAEQLVPEDQHLTYGGWFVKKKPKDGSDGSPSFGPCYRRDQTPPGETQTCEERYPNWWPGHRRAMYEDTPINAQLGQGTDTRKLSDVLGAIDCSTGEVPREEGTETVGGKFGYDAATDKRNDTNGAMDASVKLYGCDADRRPYTWVREVVPDDPETGRMDEVHIWFKTIGFEDWFNDYWIFCEAVGNPVAQCTSDKVLTFIKSSALQADPSLGAVPPFPNFDSLDDNYNQKICRTSGAGCDFVSGNGTLTGNEPSINWGTCVEGSDGVANNCDGASDPRTLLLTGGDYRITGGEAHGTILVGPNANLEISGNFRCWCTIIIDGNLTQATGTPRVFGGLVAKNVLAENGAVEVFAGGAVASIPRLGKVEAVSWWQR